MISEEQQGGTLDAVQGIPSHPMLGNVPVSDLKKRSVRGGAVTISAQGLKFVVTALSQVILARLLSPADFGLQAMVLAVTGLLGLFGDVGLSMATVQRDVVTHEQTSTLFWISVAVGVSLSALTCMAAPFLVIYFKEPRLFWMTIVCSSIFTFNGLAAQHQALMARSLRFGTMVTVDVLGIGVCTVVGIVMAKMGFGYWALIAMAVSGPLVSAIAAWILVPWTPGLPKRRCDIRSMVHMGGTLTINNIVIYFGYNTEKFLLGRFWGAGPLGLYGKAYQLINQPLQQLSWSMFKVVFPTLSRIQNDGERACRYFMKSYSLLLSVCVPITLCSALFADDIIPVVLGPKWAQSIPILRLLAPTIITFALINPFGWFLLATGRAVRSLLIGCLVTPVVIAGIVLGLPHGPTGVATGYSSAMILLIAPNIIWAIKGTGIRLMDVIRAIKGPMLSGVIALFAGLLIAPITHHALPQILRLLVDLSIVLVTYFSVLLFGMGQWSFYSDLIKQFMERR